MKIATVSLRMLQPANVPARLGPPWGLAAGDVCMFAESFVAGQLVLLCIMCWKYVKEMFSSMWYLDLSHSELKTAEQSPAPDLICPVCILAKEKAGVRNTSAPSAFHREI